MVAMRIRSDEGGLLSLEAAFAYPVFFLFVFVLIQFSWIGFQIACLDYSVYAAGWSLDATRAKTTPTLDDLVVTAVQQDWTPLDPKCLTVENARATFTEKQVTSPTRDENDRQAFLIERTTSKQRFMHIVADIEYTIELLVDLPGFSSITIARHLDKTQLVDARFEVS
ncbi:MAG: hypothetical protein RR186_03570 [Raoultibacter sp.]